MTPIERFNAKIKFLDDAEQGLRRRLSAAERFLLARIFETVINGMDLEEGRVARSDHNYGLTDKLGRIYVDFTKSHVLPATARLATTFLEIPTLNRDYFRMQADTKRLQQKVERITGAADRYIRTRIGLDANGNLKPGGYLQTLSADTTIQSELRRILGESIDNGLDVRGLRRELDNYLKGRPPLRRIEGQPVPRVGALEGRFNKYAFDLLQEADRSVNLRFSTELDLQFATYAGGVIENTRQWCCERNGLTFTREEMEAFNKEDWSGKKGDCEVFGGGHRCRHGWMFIATTRGLKARPDIKEVLRDGAYVLTYSNGSGNPPLNRGCAGRK